ncbi:NUDIX domain-containing protein [Streptomyces sp. SID3343]|uniref:NUDIX hydrolase n=1 Tax=Streptomyces sp. SID3343 TaxID=2690260 RepID=UPI00136AE4A1|nr:NUDIX domain-containing protein [Streptomyces sp. SID3343]MYW04513.1 NUDIX domain-containing protein [Streptomyces sp. SID3343]
MLLYMSNGTEQEQSTPRHSVSVAGAVVRADGKLLMIRRRDNGRWEPPGGVLELEETVEAGVEREILEETGVSVEVERLTGVYKNMPRGIVALFFRCRPVEGEAAPTEESSQVTWMTPDEAATHMNEAYAVRVLDALDDSTGPHVRAHDGRVLV